MLELDDYRKFSPTANTQFLRMEMKDVDEADGRLAFVVGDANLLVEKIQMLFCYSDQYSYEFFELLEIAEKVSSISI
jgi:hypothetical protein